MNADPTDRTRIQRLARALLVGAALGTAFVVLLNAGALLVLTQPAEPDAPTLALAPADDAPSPWTPATTPAAVPAAADPADTRVRRVSRAAGPYFSIEEALADARAGDVVELADDGPFDLRPSRLTERAFGGLGPIRADLTIRAASGACPVLRMACRSEPNGPRRWALICVCGADLLLEGLHVAVDTGHEAGPARIDVVHSTGGDVALRACTITGRGVQTDRLTAVSCCAPGRSPGQPGPAVVLTRCVLRRLGRVVATSPYETRIGISECVMAGVGRLVEDVPMTQDPAPRAPLALTLRRNTVWRAEQLVRLAGVHKLQVDARENIVGCRKGVMCVGARAEVAWTGLRNVYLPMALAQRWLGRLDPSAGRIDWSVDSLPDWRAAWHAPTAIGTDICFAIDPARIDRLPIATDFHLDRHSPAAHYGYRGAPVGAPVHSMPVPPEQTDPPRLARYSRKQIFRR